MSVEVGAGTVLRGDQVMVGGQEFTVADMITLAPGRKRLHFATGETLTIAPSTVLWATRRMDTRLRRRRDHRAP
ncbi:hypothetical protein RM590_07340 [Streptomyces sp. DSM 44938]|uniref:Uncharacterized protein n=1 Tax=Streptomyces litchfieldiae TaxID=3075543 RepID=A0ABU2MLF7_9ACTN|nr:hypothetical protein [Streptomyces sp. DSM 44938]